MRRGSSTNRLMDRWLGTPALNLLATLKPRRRAWPAGTIARIGMMCSPALGDTLLFSGVLADVRAAFPAAYLVHFCMPSSLAAAEILGDVDERVVLPLTRPQLCLARLHAAKLDVLLDLSAWQRLTALLTMLSGARFTAGFRTPGQGRGRAFDVAVEHRRDQHELENFRDLLRAIGVPAGQPPRVCLGRLARMPLAGEQDLLVLHPWASGARAGLREWPAARWVELAERLAQPGTLTVVSGGPADRERSAVLVRALCRAGVRATSWAGDDGLRSLAAVLARARLVVSVNTGVMHLAAIVGAPTLGLNGPTAGHRWGPLGPHAAGVAPDDGSGGTLHLGFEFGRRPVLVMDRISVDSVVRAAEDLLARSPQPAARGAA